MDRSRSFVAHRGASEGIEGAGGGRRGRVVAGVALTTLAVAGFGLAGRPPRAEAEARALPAPPDSARVELGRRLFFDPVVSRTGTRSCADCHDADHGFSDTEPLSRDARGLTPRRTQTLVDCADSPTMDWLGAFRTLEEVVAARTEPVEPKPLIPPYYGGVVTPTDPTLQFVASNLPNASIPLPHKVLAASGRYRRGFLAAYGEATPTPQRIVRAIADYCRTIRSGESAYDRWKAGDDVAMSAAAIRGHALFEGPAGCAACHTTTGKRAAFTDYRFHDTGLPPPTALRLAPTRERLALRTPFAAFAFELPLLATVGVAPAPVTLPDGRLASGFKTPTLRDVALRGPFLHDGSLATLDDVVRFFLRRRTDVPPADPATEAGEVRDLVEFLKALTSSVRPGTPRTAWSIRLPKTELRVVDADGEPLADHEVTLVPCGERLPGAPAALEPFRVTTDGKGRASFAFPKTTHVRVALEGGMLPTGGCWIPDTCWNTEVRLPVDGRARLRVLAPAGVALPDTLELAHTGPRIFPERKEHRTYLRRESVATTGGRVVALYTGLRRTDVATETSLVLPPAVRYDIPPPTLRFDRGTVTVRLAPSPAAPRVAITEATAR